MKKRIGITIVIMVAVMVGGFSFANIYPTESQQNTAIPDKATSVAFQNNGNSWKHVVAAFDVTQTDGTVKNIYADLWVKPQGTANVDLSGILGYGSQPLPDGTKMQVKTYTDPNVSAPQGATDNKVTTTTDPAQGGDFLSALTSRVSALDPTVITPRQIVVADITASILRNGRAVASAIAAVPLCANAGGTVASVPLSPSGTIGPVIASTPRITIVLPL